MEGNKKQELSYSLSHWNIKGYKRHKLIMVNSFVFSVSYLVLFLYHCLIIKDDWIIVKYKEIDKDK
jgi:hypothetical protein